MKTLSLLSLIIFNFYFTACDSASTNPKSDGTFTVRDFLPTGITWTYDIKEFDETGTQTHNYSRKLEVFKIPSYKGFDTYTYSDLSKPTDTSAFYYSGDTSLYFVHRPSGTTDYTYLYPMNIGDVRYRPMGSSDTEAFTLRSVSVPVNVVAGTYNCLEYKEARYGQFTLFDTSSVSYKYISPKNGLIKSVIYRFSSGVRYKAFEQELALLVRR